MANETTNVCGGQGPGGISTQTERAAGLTTLANYFEAAAIVELSSGDREPSYRVSDADRRLIVRGLRLAAAVERAYTESV